MRGFPVSPPICGLLLLALTYLLSASAMAAVDVGVAAAVRPDATGTRLAGGMRLLYAGIDVEANERIETSARGQTHLLFRDGSALTIGPNASMVLDRFVYDSASGTGEIAVSVTKGLFRFVGGRISKKQPVLFSAPNAVIGIRGGVAMIDVADGSDAAAPPVSVIMLYGQETFMQSGAQRQSMSRPGFVIAQLPDGGIALPALATTEQLNGSLARLEDPVPADESTPLGAIAPAAGGATVSDEDVSRSQLSSLGSANAPQSLSVPIVPTSTPDTGTIGNEVVAASQRQALEEPSGSRNPSSPSPIVTPPPGDPDPGPDPGTGPGSGPPPPSGGVTIGAVGGRGRCCEVDARGTNDVEPINNFVLTPGSLVANGHLVASGAAGSFALRFPGPGLSALTGADISGSVFHDFALPVSGLVTVAAAGDFAAYELWRDTAGNERGLIVAGAPTPAAAIPASGFTTFALLDDFTLAHAPFATRVPFVDGIHPPGIPNDSAKAYVVWDDSGFNAERVLGVGRVVIAGSTAQSQVSGGSVLTGMVVDGLNGHPFVYADMRGSSHQATGFAGDRFHIGIGASLPTATGEHFYGAAGPQNFLMAAAVPLVGEEPMPFGVFTTTGSIVQPNATYPNAAAISGSHSTAPPLGARNSLFIEGHVGGLFLDYEAGESVIDGVGRVISQYPQSTSPGLFILTDAPNNTLEVSLRGHSSRDGDFLLRFGDDGTTGNSAFISNKIFMAVEDSSGTGHFDGVSIDTGFSYFTTAHDLQISGLLPGGVSLCACNHLTWGFFGTYLINPNSDSTVVGNLLTWVAGNPATNPAQYPSGIVATYNGHVWGTVFNGTTSYQAVGGLSMTVEAMPGAIVAVNGGQITNFDGGNYQLTDGLDLLSSSPPAIFHASVNLTSKQGYVPGDIQGVLSGNFYGPGSLPANAAGTFELQRVAGSGAPYQAAGIVMARNAAEP